MDEHFHIKDWVVMNEADCCEEVISENCPVPLPVDSDHESEASISIISYPSTDSPSEEEHESPIKEHQEKVECPESTSNQSTFSESREFKDTIQLPSRVQQFSGECKEIGHNEESVSPDKRTLHVESETSIPNENSLVPDNPPTVHEEILLNTETDLVEKSLSHENLVCAQNDFNQPIIDNKGISDNQENPLKCIELISHTNSEEQLFHEAFAVQQADPERDEKLTSNEKFDLQQEQTYLGSLGDSVLQPEVITPEGSNRVPVDETPTLYKESASNEESIPHEIIRAEKHAEVPEEKPFTSHTSVLESQEYALHKKSISYISTTEQESTAYMDLFPEKEISSPVHSVFYGRSRNKDSMLLDEKLPRPTISKRRSRTVGKISITDFKKNPSNKRIVQTVANIRTDLKSEKHANGRIRRLKYTSKEKQELLVVIILAICYLLSMFIILYMQQSPQSCKSIKSANKFSQDPQTLDRLKLNRYDEELLEPMKGYDNSKHHGQKLRSDRYKRKTNF